MIPREIDVTLRFDRGFRRVSPARNLKELGCHFVVRCLGDTGHVARAGWSIGGLARPQDRPTPWPPFSHRRGLRGQAEHPV